MLKELKMTFANFSLSPKQDQGTRDLKHFVINTRPIHRKVRKNHEFRLDEQIERG